MTFCLLTNIVSPHQMPLARQLAARLGAGQFRYIATEPLHQERMSLGWDQQGTQLPEWVVQLPEGTRLQDHQTAWEWALDADVLLSGHRYFDLFEARAKAKRLTLYMSERWFKPPVGMLRLIHPQYMRMGLRLKGLLSSPFFYYLPIGVTAATDVSRLLALLSGKVQSLFCAPRLSLRKREPLATFIREEEASEETDPHGHWSLSKMLLWAYFVESQPAELPSDAKNRVGELRHSPAGTGRQPCCGSAKELSPGTAQSMATRHEGEPLSVLWVGRMIGWKRVDTLLDAVRLLNKSGRPVELKLVGEGPEIDNLRRMAGKLVNESMASGGASHGSRGDSPVKILAPVPISSVRRLMREAHVYVLCSTGQEGWGAVLNEAMFEKCPVVSTCEAGSATVLIQDGENGLLFQTGDSKGLAHALSRIFDDEGFRERLATSGFKTVSADWVPEVAAARLVSFCERHIN